MHRLDIILLAFFIMMSFSTFEKSLASENIMITLSNDRERIIYDGKWTDVGEWKRTSLNEIDYDDDIMVILRTAHQGDFLYVFIDPIYDNTLDRDQDEATLCIDGKNEKNKLPDQNDFCFTAKLDNKEGTMSQGNIVEQNNFQTIPNQDGFIGISSVSDENDRYEPRLHPSYEFRIPINLFGRSDNYGFFLSVYDASSNSFYNWPKNITRTDIQTIPTPAEWGDLVSPDKSLPEFDLPLLILLPSLILVIYLTRSRINYEKNSK